MGKSRAVKPTRDQKEMIASAGLIWKNWLVIKETPEALHIVSRGTGRNRVIKKPLQVGKPSQRHEN